MRRISILSAIVFVFYLGVAAVADAETNPIERAHAHNDYVHEHPLTDALNAGFCSVEADIHLAEDGALLVGHDKEDLKPERTLQALYLDPLRDRVKANGGKVYPNGPTIMLLIDLKTDGEQTYAALRDVLKNYADILTEFTADSTKEKGVTVVITGSTPRETIAAESPRFAAIDGRKKDLETNPSVNVVPLVSEAWRPLFEWYGKEDMPAEVRKELNDFVEKVHAQGRRVRFYAAPDHPEIWKELLKADVDLINTDKLVELSAFLAKNDKRKTK
jgi:glycerophosphoryl diester phosphodiesterase